jgi:hypothetical protein
MCFASLHSMPPVIRNLYRELVVKVLEGERPHDTSSSLLFKVTPVSMVCKSDHFGVASAPRFLLRLICQFIPAHSVTELFMSSQISNSFEKWILRGTDVNQTSFQNCVSCPSPTLCTAPHLKRCLTSWRLFQN